MCSSWVLLGVESSRVLLGLELCARVQLRSRRSRAYVFESIPVWGCKYKRYVRYVSTDERKRDNKKKRWKDKKCDLLDPSSSEDSDLSYDSD